MGAVKGKRGWFPLVGVALDSPVKPKRNRVRDIDAAKAKIRRTVRKAPEVLVKVSGGVKGAQHLKSHMDYITRNGRIEAENERGELIQTREQLREEHRHWIEQLGKPRKNERDTLNLVLSMPAGTDPEAVRRAARDFAKEQFSNHQYLMALHCKENDKDTKNPHVHLTVKTRGLDGERLHPRKADLQEWRESFAEKMRQQGYEAEATPRRSRGVVQKAKTQVVWGLENRPKKDKHGNPILNEQGKPIVKGSLVMRAKLATAAAELQGRAVAGNPARETIKATQEEVRAGWLAGAKALAASPDKDDQDLARRIGEFVEGLPKTLQDERSKLKAQLAAVLAEKTRKKEAGHEAPPLSPEDRGKER